MLITGPHSTGMPQLPECSSTYRLNIKHWIEQEILKFSELEVYKWGSAEY